MTGKMPRRSYDKEFKISAVMLVLDSDRSVGSIAKDLGVSGNALFNWKRKYLADAKNAFPGKGHLKPQEEEIRKLKNDLAHVTMERDIPARRQGGLKKAVTFFAKDAR